MSCVNLILKKLIKKNFFYKIIFNNLNNKNKNFYKFKFNLIKFYIIFRENIYWRKEMKK